MLVAPHGRSPLVIIDFGLSLYIGDVKGYQSKWSVGSMLYVRHLLHRSPPAEQESTKVTNLCRPDCANNDRGDVVLQVAE